MRGYRELLEKEVIEAWRTYRVAILAVLSLALGIGCAVFVRYAPALVMLFAPPDYEIGLEPAAVPDVVDQLVRSVTQVGALTAILLAMGSVAAEKERGTAAFVLAKPVTRIAFLTAKWVVLAMLLGMATGLAVLGAWLYTGVLVERVPVVPWVQLALVLWLTTLVYASITLLGSTVLPSPLAAAGLGVLAVLGLSLAAGVPTLSPWLPAGLPEVAVALALEETSVDLDPMRTIGASVLIIAASLGLAWWYLRRQEL